MLFGKDETILSVLPHHRTDALLQRGNPNRYDDRDDIRTNLIESRHRLMAFGEKHLPDPFYLEGNQRLSLRSIILREVVGNLLIHREFANATPARFVIEEKRMWTENSNVPHGNGPIDPHIFSPYPKNPLIARVFKEIGWADELGSGVRNLFHFGTHYGGEPPVLIEKDILRFELKIPDDVETGSKTGAKTGAEIGAETSVHAGLNETAQKILQEMRNNPNVTTRELVDLVGVWQSNVNANIKKLRERGYIRRVGSRKAGQWEVLI